MFKDVNWLAVLFQLVDFLFKAAGAYMQTPQGKSEFEDIVVAWETRANSEDNGGSAINYTSEKIHPSAAEAGQADQKPKRNTQY